VAEVKDLLVPVGYQLPAFTEPELLDIAEYFRSHQNGIGKFVPRVCHGPSCPDHADCPLVRLGKNLPMGRMCFTELNLINTWAQAMASELGLKENDVFDRWQIGGMVLNGILIKRAAEILGRADMVVDSFRGFTPDGQAVMEQKAHPAIGIIDTLQKRNQALQTDLMATRKEKSKDDARKRLSPTEVLQKLRDKMRLAQEGVEHGQQQLLEHRRVLDAEYHVVEVKNAGTNGELRSEHQGNGWVDGAVQADQAGQVLPVQDHDHVQAAEGNQEGQGKLREVKLRRDPKTGVLVEDV
jgi:hypothetical protein